jgi:dihydrofolate reductase
MSALRRIEGYAIVSADGMIADASGVMPASIRNPADQKFLQAGLDQAAVVVHGRRSHEGGPRSARRKRLIVTRGVGALGGDASNPNVRLWNPAGASLEAALETLGVGDGRIAIIGGTEVFGLFLPRYDVFHLTRAENAEIPGGRPVFPEVGPNSSAEEVLARHGLNPGRRRDIDAAAGITLVTWERGGPAVKPD